MSRLDMIELHRAWMSPPVRHTSQLTGPEAIHCPQPDGPLQLPSRRQSVGPHDEHAIQNLRPRRAALASVL